MKLNYVVTGSGRSGTVYMARLLTSLGIPCGHEMIFDYQGIQWALRRLAGEHPVQLSWASRSTFEQGRFHEVDKWLPDTSGVEAESSYMVAPYLSEPCLENAKVIHVVRDPIKVVHSFCNYINYFTKKDASNAYEQFIYRILPEMRQEMPQYDRASLFWVMWNEMIESHKPDLFYRMEDDIKVVLEFLGKEGPHFNDNTINTYRKPTAERFYPDKIQSKEIFQRFAALAKRYGYALRSEYLLM
jgi:hypothetical protein